MSAFTDWLNRHLNKRNWSISELARMSKGKAASQSNISKVLSGKLAPTADFCLVVARALGEPEVDALYLAGHLHNREQHISFDQPLMLEIYEAFKQLTPDQRQFVLAVIKMVQAGTVVSLAPSQQNSHDLSQVQNE